RPRIAVVDMAVVAGSPAGSCVLAEVQGLAAQFDVTVFSERFEPAGLPGVELVRVRAPDRPVLFRYVAFHLGVPMHYLLWRLRGGRADCVQATQGQLPGAAICYAHFCHRAYLKTHWHKSAVDGPRRWARLAMHRFNAWCEAAAISRAQLVVAPSVGLARELVAEYPACAAKIRVVANPVATAHFTRPHAFDRPAARERLGFAPQQIVLGFMALGDFSRKGLGLLLEALAALPPVQRDALGLLVVGGRAGEIAEFEAMAERLSLAAGVRFVGMQQDVRPFLWACDVFAFPSAYEIFSLAVMQAAAAGLPVLVCDGVYGSEEFVVDGRNGWSIARDPRALATWFERLLAERERLPAMGAAAAASVEVYDLKTFQARWSTLIGALVAGTDTQPRAVAGEPGDR
ncbi:MAG: glycosyltransferase family 4 protein, partial [Rhizobiales bacterium]|nr:glycosyltransferase family 4 protein [Rhizobacter sp.]